MNEPSSTHLDNCYNAIPDKRSLYKTAKARISCARFQAGDYVSVLYFGIGEGGQHWFLASKSGKANEAVAYPQHHLTDFCL
jgi:hypothetical protein